MSKLYESAAERAAYLVGTEATNVWREVMTTVERAIITQTLEMTGGNQSRAAEILGITRTTLTERVKRYDLQKYCTPTGDQNRAHFAAKREGGAA